MSLELVVMGDEKARRRMNKFAHEMKGRKLITAVKKGCLLVEATAKRIAPVDTGRLRASITTRLDLFGSGVEGKVGTNVEYARSLEFGDKKHRRGPRKGHPTTFLRPALSQHSSRIKLIIEKAIASMINEV